MKKYLVSIVAGILVLCSFNNLFAEEMKFSGSLDIGYFSHYVGWPGTTVYDDSVFQQSIGATLDPLGLYVKAWSSYSPKNGFNSDFGDEIDYIIGIYQKFGKIGVDVSYTFYNMYNMNNTTGDLHALVLHIDSPEILFVKPYLTLENDIPVDKEILEGGFIYRAGVKYNINLPKSQIIDLNVSFSGHDGAFGKRTETVSSAKLAISSTFQLWKVAITPTVNFQKRLGYKPRDGGMTEDKIWYGVNCSVPF